MRIIGVRGTGIAEHRLEDRAPRSSPARGRAHDLLRHAGDLDVHLQGGDPVPRAGHLEVHVTEVILGALDVREDDVVVALLDEAHRDARDGRRDRDAGVHERKRRAHTDPIDDEPFDSSVSETTRIVYGKSSTGGMTASSARCARAWPMSRRFGPRMKPVSPTEKGGKL